MFAADGSSHVEHFAIQIDGQGSHLRRVDRIRQIEERPNVKLAMAGVRKQRRGDLVLFEHVLHSDQKIGHAPKRHRQILDERDRPARAFHPVERGNHLLREPAVPLHLDAVLSLQGVKRQPLLSPHSVDDLQHPIPHFGDRVPLEFDQQHGLGFGRNQLVVKCRTLAGQAQMPPIHQIAGAWPQRHRFGGGSGGILQAIEQQQHDAAMPRQRLRRHDDFGNQRQRPFRAGQQFRQIEFLVAQHAPQLITATIHQTARLMRFDELSVTKNQVGQFRHQPAARRLRIELRPSHRLAAHLHHLAVGQTQSAGCERAVAPNHT